MALNTNFNVEPYYDDYDEEKNYHRVLFRPAVPIQARELTQLQSILQNQVERFGDNIYRQGTIIKGCSLNFDYNYSYVKIRDLQIDGQSVIVSSYANAFVEDSSGLKSKVVNYYQGLESQNPDLSTLFVKYINTGAASKKKYANGDVLTVYASDYSIQGVTISSEGSLYTNSDIVVFTGGGGSGATANIVTYSSNGSIRDVVITNPGSGYTSSPNVTITTSTGSSASLTALNYIAQITVANSSFTNPVGVGSAVTVSDGIVYQKGHFVRVEEQTTIADKYSNLPSNVSLGFATYESIVNSNSDSTLLDNAQGYSNYTAPGAHRLKLTANLIAIPTVDAQSNNDFFSILEFDNGNVTKRRTGTEFNSVASELAKRTREESGNYVVKPFTIYTEEISGNTTHLNLSVSSGVGYVDGFRSEISGTVRTPIRKANDTITSTNQTISTNFGNYVVVNEVLGNFDFSTGAAVNLRNTAADDATDNFGGAPTSSIGTIIGTAKVKSFMYQSGTPGTPNCEYRLYLYDIVMEPGSRFSQTRSIQASGGIADIVLEDGSAVLKETSFDTLIFSSGANAVSYFENEQFIYRKVGTTSILTTGIGSVQLTGSEEFPYTALSTLNDTQEQDFIIVPGTNAHSTTALSGTVGVTGNVVSGTGTTTSFISELDVGDYIKFSGNNSYYRVSTITSANSMTIEGSTGPSLVANTLSWAFPKNIPIRLNRGSANITIDSTGNTASVFVGNTINSTTSATVYFNSKVDGAGPKAKSVVKSVYVKLSTDKLAANTLGPWCIGVPDAYKLVGVYANTGNVYSNTTTNYASSFELLNGQTDNEYGLSYIRKKPGSTISLTASTCLLVRVDLFTHGTGYYLSTESYPVDDSTVPLPSNKIRTENIPYYRSPKTGKYFNLRDTIDFRPIVANTANVSTTVAGATVDPSSTETLSGTLYYPTPNEAFEADITNYLQRTDTVVLDVYGNVTVIEGKPDNNPVPPRATDGTMRLGTVYVPPYPSLSPQSASQAQRNEYSTLIKTEQIKGYTMKDIKQIEDRVNRIEYYSLLNTLEKSTTDLIIPSESNTSINRFKNGFFAESFSTYDISNVNDPEYSIYVDTKTSTARPQIQKTRLNLRANTSGSSNVTFKGEYALLNYDERLFLSQDIASKSRNPTQLSWNFKGRAELFPKYDDYYDVEKGQVNVTIDLATPLNALTKAINDNVSFKGDSKQISTSATAFTTKVAATVASTGIDERTLTTTTTTVTNSLQPGDTQSNLQQVGEFVTDFGLKPYMRALPLTFRAVGLRPSTQHYVFFDKVDVSSRCRPASVDNIETMDPRGVPYEEGASFTGPVGSALTTDSTGTLTGVFYVPEETFFVGDRPLLITDTNDINSLETAISSASATFSAYNFYKDTSRLSVTTKSPQTITAVSNTTVDITRVVESRITPRVTPPVQICCFIAGTKITLADGTVKNIEDVQIGDKLIGKDKSVNQVLEYVRPLLGERTLVSLNGGDPFMTHDHPVYMKDGTWKSFDPEATKKKYEKLSDWNIGKLEIGDVIETVDGVGFKIQSMSEHQDRADLQVYNFSLDGNHTYIANGLVVHNKCFVKGTKVLVENGTNRDWVNIEDVQQGEVLVGKDQSKNKILRLHRPTLGFQDHILPHKLRLACINGKEFSVSEDHIFCTTSGWRAPTAVVSNIIHKHTIEAEGFSVTDLQVGDHIITNDGKTVEVISLDFKEDDPDTQLYNFWTDGNHTYHVRMAGHEDGMLVHNKCFVKGTEVLLNDGTWKTIEDVGLDDVLLGENGFENKVKEFHRPTLGLNDHILPHNLRLASINGSEFAVSEDHMIKTTSGWKTPTVDMCKILHAETLKNERINISELSVGDEIICSDGSLVKVESVEFKEDSPDLQLYNFRLHGNKTYHVRMKGTDKFILVHNKDPLAQTFIVNKNDGSDGVYVTKINLYFRKKDTEAGVTVQIRETINGYPGPLVIAQKVLRASSVNISELGTVATPAVFDTPVYLKNGVDYCVVITPDQFNPNYQVWVGETGAPDVSNPTRFSTFNWGEGVMFLSSNDRVWTPYQGEDLKFDVFIADFNKTSGTVLLENDRYEFLTLSNTSGSFVASEEVAQKSNTYLSGTFTCNTANVLVNTSISQTSSVAAGDYVLIVYANTAVLKTGTVSANITSPQVNGTSTVFETEYDPGDYLLINGEVREVTSIASNTVLTLDAPLKSAVSANAHSGVSKRVQVSKTIAVNSSTITLKDFPSYRIDGGTTYYGAIQKVVRGVVDVLGNDDTIILKDSNAANSVFLFESGKNIVGEQSQATATISSVDDKLVNYSESYLRYISPPSTSVILTQKIDRSSGGAAANNVVTEGVSNPISYEAEVKSTSNEITSGSKSLKLYASLSRTGTHDSVSPVIDIEPASVVVLKNIINNDYTNETTRYGNSQVRYISKSVVLADGLDAEDIKVYITAYKPSTSNILVYAKIISSDDNESFESKAWTLLNQVTESNLYSDSLDENNYIEYEYGFALTPPSSTVAGVITSSSNSTLTGTGTTFSSSFANNDVVKVINTSNLTDYDVSVVDTVSNNTHMTLKTNTSFTSTTAKIEKVTDPAAAFKYNRESNVVTYFDTGKGRHSSYKTFAIKVVLVSSSTKYVPILKDLRALAVSI